MYCGQLTLPALIIFPLILIVLYAILYTIYNIIAIIYYNIKNPELSEED